MDWRLSGSPPDPTQGLYEDVTVMLDWAGKNLPRRWVSRLP
jgi:hypothetical protein